MSTIGSIAWALSLGVALVLWFMWLVELMTAAFTIY